MKLPVPLLAAAAFAMLTNEFNIIGVIPLIAQDLDVPVPQVGLLVTAFAFTVAITGPFLTLALRRVERRQLFTGVLAVTAVGAAIAAMAPNYGVLAAGRIASALALPVFWSMATSTAARISEPGNAGRAISTVFAACPSRASSDRLSPRYWPTRLDGGWHLPPAPHSAPPWRS